MSYSFKTLSACLSLKMRHIWLRLTGKSVYIPIEKIQIPIFKIVKNPEIRLSEFKSRRFNIIDRNSIIGRYSISPDGDSRYQARQLESIISSEDVKIFQSVSQI